MASIISVSNETNASVERMTKDGRNLTYQMNVLQQPQRARACGSGAKSSADRRPVDPPPVVELKILEGESKKDITFSHNANFFLYTTLEPARQIAPARGNSVPAPHPVLTGMPVAGMAYLDRPTQAGYFIFPDLSVRHEGKFRLSFNLYEELKETKDMDTDSVANNPDHPSNHHVLRSHPMAANAHVHFRLEVKSEPFTVYSAKKFPGLAESTTLSRVVAEQGCRVRIRRDVRMRRRETKPSKDYDFDDDSTAPSYPQTDRYATPDTYNRQSVERARSVSTVSVDESQPYSARERSSSRDRSCVPPYSAAIPPSKSQTPTNGYPNMSFGNSAPSYQAPAQPAPQYQHSAHPSPAQPAHAQPTSVHAASAYPSPTTQSYHQQTPLHRRSSSNGGSHYSYNPPHQYQQSQPPSHPPYAEHPDYRRPGTQSGTSFPPSQPYMWPVVDARFQGPSPNANGYPMPPLGGGDARSSTPSHGTKLPPLKTIQPASDRMYEQPSLSATSVAVSTSSPSDPYDMLHLPRTPARSVKRAYGKVFDQSHLNHPTHHGSRPEAVGLDVVQVECDGNLVDEDDLPSLKMLSYRRADGSRQQKQVPDNA